MEPLSAREQRKLQDEIARQEKQERVAGQQRLVREGQSQKQQKVSAAADLAEATCKHVKECSDQAVVDLQRQQEMLQHQQAHGHWLSQLEAAPTFYPTEEEFQDPISYIRSIQTEGSKHGTPGALPRFALRSILVRTNLTASQASAKLSPRSSLPYPAAW